MLTSTDLSKIDKLITKRIDSGIQPLSEKIDQVDKKLSKKIDGISNTLDRELLYTQKRLRIIEEHLDLQTPAPYEI